MAPDRRQQRERREAAGEWLRRTRKERGFATMGALARRLGVHESLISRYETGMSEVSDDRAEQIADVFAMDIITVRRNLGLWVPDDDSAHTDAPSTLSPLDDLPEDPDERREALVRMIDQRTRETAEIVAELNRLTRKTG